MSGSATLSAIFSPEAVGVVGISRDPRKLGNQVLTNILRRGFAGRVVAIGHPVEQAGVEHAASIDQLDAAPELLFIATPAAAAAEIVSKAGPKGTRAAIIGASGFGEGGLEGKRLEDELAEAARTAGVRLVGPNCNGIYASANALSIGFNAGHAVHHPAGRVAILSHSGAMFEAMARRLDHFGGGLSAFVSTGNELDLSILDYLEHCVGDLDTDVIALLLDSISDGRRFRALAEGSRLAGKTILALKIGESEAGAAAALAHSSRMAGSREAYRALLHAAGVPMASSLEGLMAAAAMASRFGRRDGGLSALSTSGAGASIIADFAARHDVRLTSYAPDTIVSLSGRRRFSSFANPTDLGVFGTLDGLDTVITTMARDEDTAVFLCMLHTLGETRSQVMAKALRASIESTGKPHIILAPGGLPEADRAAYEAAGAVVFVESAACFDAVAALTLTTVVADDATTGNMTVEVRTDATGALSEIESLDLLSQAGIHTIPSVACKDADDAVARAENLGWPVVLKGEVEGCAHKTEKGLVVVDIGHAAALREAFLAMDAPTKLLQPMIKGDLEAILGFTDSAELGPMLIVGLGGIHAEAINDTTLWSLPATRSDMEAGLDASALGRVLSSNRWKHPDARTELLSAMEALQVLALRNRGRIAAIDVNPVILGAQGAIAVDGLVVLQDL